MARIKHSMEQIIAKKLRKADLMLSEGRSVDEVAKAVQVNKLTYYRLKKRIWWNPNRTSKKT